MPHWLKKFAVNLIPIRRWRKKIRRRGSLACRYKTAQKHFRMGKASYAGKDLRLANRESTIGKYCSIADNVHIGTGTHPTSFLSTHPMQYMELPFGPKISSEFRCEYRSKQPCHIGNDVWIGLSAIIMDGITVGSGAVIAAGAVVTQNVPPYAIVGGVPAKVIKYRFSPEIIEQLLDLRWWDLPDGDLIELPFSNIDACIRILTQIRADLS